MFTSDTTSPESDILPFLTDFNSDFNSDPPSGCNSVRSISPFDTSSSSASSSSLPRTPTLRSPDLLDFQLPLSSSSLNLSLNQNLNSSKPDSISDSKRLEEVNQFTSDWSNLSEPLSCYTWTSLEHRPKEVLPGWSSHQHGQGYPSGPSPDTTSYYSGSTAEPYSSSYSRTRVVEHSHLRSTGLPFVHSSNSQTSQPWSNSYQAPSHPHNTSSTFPWDVIQERTSILSGSPVLSPRNSISGLPVEYASSSSSSGSRKRSIDDADGDYQDFQPSNQGGFQTEQFYFALPASSLAPASHNSTSWASNSSATPTQANFPAYTHRRAQSQARPAPLLTHLRTRSFDLPSPTYALLQQQLMGESSTPANSSNQASTSALSCTGSPRSSSVDWFSMDTLYGSNQGPSSSSTEQSQVNSLTLPGSRKSSVAPLNNNTVSSESSSIGLVKNEQVALEAHSAEHLAGAVLQPPPTSKDKPVPYPVVTIHCPNPPPEDFECSDISARPMRQTGKLKTRDDAYSARWIRYEAQAREAWCSKCEESVPQKWLQLKNSAYGYHTKNVHGISSHTGRQFAPPIAMKVDDQHLNHGQCFRCESWVQISSRRNLSWGAWYKHSAMCEASYHREKAQANRNSISTNSSDLCESTGSLSISNSTSTPQAPKPKRRRT